MLPQTPDNAIKLKDRITKLTIERERERERDDRKDKKVKEVKEPRTTKNGRAESQEAKVWLWTSREYASIAL